jgi:hypothetical protein
MATLINLCRSADKKMPRDVADTFCHDFDATPLKGGSTGWGVRGRFFSVSISDSNWAAYRWHIEGIHSVFGLDVNAIYSLLSSCNGYTDYREAMNRKYGDRDLGHDEKLHSRENNWFWNKFRYDVAAGAESVDSCLMWPIPKSLADSIWQRR